LLEFNIKFFEYFNLLSNNNINKKYIRNYSNISSNINKKIKIQSGFDINNLESDSNIIKVENNKIYKECIIIRNLLDINLLEKPSLEIYLKRFFNNSKAKFNNIS